MNILKTPQDGNLAISKHDPRPTGILNRKLGLSVLTGDTADGAAEMFAGERLDVLDLEGLDVELGDPDQGHGVVDVEAHGEGVDEVDAGLEAGGRLGVLGGAELDAFGFGVHADLELEVLHQGDVDLGPGGLEGGHAVRGDGDFADVGFADGVLVLLVSYSPM